MEMVDRALQFDPLRYRSEDELKQLAFDALVHWKTTVDAGDVERADEAQAVFVEANEKFKTRSAKKKKENPNLHSEF